MSTDRKRSRDVQAVAGTRRVPFAEEVTKSADGTRRVPATLRAMNGYRQVEPLSEPHEPDLA